MLVNSFYPPVIRGGATLSVQNLAEALVGLGHDVHVTCLAGPSAGEPKSVRGVSVHRVKVASLGRSPVSPGRSFFEKASWSLGMAINSRASATVAERIAAVQPDIVHTNHVAALSTGFYRYLARDGVPVVHTARDYYLLCASSTMERRGNSCRSSCLGCRPVANMRRTDMRAVQAMVFTSEFMRRTHAAVIQELGITRTPVIPNSYDADSTDGAGAATGERPFRFGYIGRITAEKGVLKLLDAFDRLQQPGLELHLAGEDEYGMLPSAVAAMRRADDVAVRGFVSPASFFPSIDALVVPSVWAEPFGRVAIEAFAHGVPVIVAASGGLPELVVPNVTGLIVDNCRDPEALAAAMRLMIERGFMRTQRAQIRAHSQQFSSAKVVATYTSIYTELTGHQDRVAAE